MDWKKYEIEIFESFKEVYPNAKISYNQKIIGRYSKVERQIDVLIEGRIAGKNIRLVLDGKFHSKKIDVKQVDSFISMIEDINANQGIIITPKGYSKAAINRAYYGPTDIELDILNFEELKQFQGFGGIVHSGWHGATFPAPFGWILDGTKRKGSIANLYQRGITYEEAVKNGEFIYVNIFSFNDEIRNLNDLIELHKARTLYTNPKANFEYTDTIERFDKKKTLLRKIIRKETNLEEYTGFVEFEEFCVFCVLFTPEQLKTKNIRKLEYVIERLLPINVDLKSVATSRINDYRNLMKKSNSNQEKAELLIGIANIHRDMNEDELASIIFKESIELLDINFGAKLGLLEIGYNSKDREKLIEDFYLLKPGNRQICDDIVRLGIENKTIEFTEKYLLNKIKSEVGNFEQLGNIYYSLADLFYTSEYLKKSLKYFRLAKINFENCFDKKHPALISTLEAIKEIENV